MICLFKLCYPNTSTVLTMLKLVVVSPTHKIPHVTYMLASMGVTKINAATERTRMRRLPQTPPRREFLMLHFFENSIAGKFLFSCADECNETISIFYLICPVCYLLLSGDSDVIRLLVHIHIHYFFVTSPYYVEL